MEILDSIRMLPYTIFHIVVFTSLLIVRRISPVLSSICLVGDCNTEFMEQGNCARYIRSFRLIQGL